jgi:hypothetical protein
MGEEEKEHEEMAEQSTDWISKHWQILVTIGIILIWGIRLESQSNVNKDNNYKLYVQFTEFKTNDKTNSDKVSTALTKVALEVNTLTTLVKGFDDRYPLRREIDSRLLKTAYRDDK